MKRAQYIRVFGSFVSLILLGAVAAGCGGPERPTPPRGGTEHLLLLDRRVLQYQERDGDKVQPYTLELLFAGGRRVKVFDAVFHGLDLGNCQFISNDTLVSFVTDQPLTPTMPLPEYRQVWVDEKAQVGDMWEDAGAGTQTVLDGYETVTVPAGTYPHCYKTVTTVVPAYEDSLIEWRRRGELTDQGFERLSSNARLVFIRWFASGVGLVKEQISDPDHVRELVAVKQIGTGRIDTTTTQPNDVQRIQ
jgi:hypothetical protein